MMRNFIFPLLLSALVNFCFAADYYVSPSGDDANPGTLSQPFQTISAAAAIMQAGDTCYIRAGTYRETVTPANSGEPGAPITFMPYNGESVTISGAEVITGWRATEASDDIHHPNIYVAPMGWDLGDGSNQVFVDGEWNVHRARWPNLGDNPDRFAPPLASGSASGDTISLSVTRPEDYWVGGTVMGWFAKSFLSTGGIISASTPSGELTLSEKTPGLCR